MAKNNFLDKTGATWLITKFKTMLNDKVDKDGNKVLSTHDYTTADKNKLKGIAEKAQVNKLEDVKVNDVSLAKTGKSVNIDLTSYAKTSEIPTDNKGLTNGAGYQTASDVDGIVAGKGYQTSAQVNDIVTKKGYQTSSDVQTAITEKGYQTAANVESIVTGKGYQTASAVDSLIVAKKYQTAGQVDALIDKRGYQTSAQVQSAIGTALSDITGIDFKIVNPLPASGVKGTIYLVSNSGSNPNAYDEYIWIGDAFEKIGTTDIDLSGYAKTADFEAISTTELDNMWKTI